MSKMKPGSIASEAARLTVELGILVTPDKVKWWRKKRYPMQDTPALMKCIRNQERIAGNPAAFKALQDKADESTEAAPDLDDGDLPPSLARLLITDKDIEDAKGFVPIGEVLDYLRDQWEASEDSDPRRYANKSEAEIEKIVRRDVAFNFANLVMLIPSITRPPWPDWLDAILYPEDAEKPDSLAGKNPSDSIPAPENSDA